jgi:hypothetical protein
MHIRVFIAASILLGACSGDAGPAGAPGGNGQNGGNGNDVILSARAKHGLDIAPVPLALAGLSPSRIEQVGIGSYWVNAVIDCSGCHNSPAGEYLAGGAKLTFDAAGDYVYTRNLTPDSTGFHHTEDQFVETMQTGRDFHMGYNGGNGLLLVMPWQNFRWMHESDLRAIYAYLKVIPPVAHQVMPDQKGPYETLTPIPLPQVFDRGEQMRTLTPETDFKGNPLPDPDGVLRGIEVNPLADPPNFLALDPADQARFGRGSYLVNAGVCNECHTNPPFNMTTDPFKITTAAFLSGGRVFQAPSLGPINGQTRSMAADLLGAAHGFFNEPEMSYPLFAGILANGEHIDDPMPTPLAWPMPWQHLRNMETEDLVSVYTYLRVLAATEPRTASDDKSTQGPAIYCDASHACPNGHSCHMDATFGNECVGNTCAGDDECGACQHCVSNACVAPSSANAADQACVNEGI